MVERAAEYRSDFCDGEIYAMAGTSRAHSFICGNIAALLHAQFKGRLCEVHSSEMRVRVADTGMYTYPDVVALCGEPRFLDGHDDTLINPQLVVEVLAPSTMGYDRSEKQWRYRQIKSSTIIYLSGRIAAESSTPAGRFPIRTPGRSANTTSFPSGSKLALWEFTCR